MQKWTEFLRPDYPKLVLGIRVTKELIPIGCEPKGCEDNVLDVVEWVRQNYHVKFGSNPAWTIHTALTLDTLPVELVLDAKKALGLGGKKRGANYNSDVSFVALLHQHLVVYCLRRELIPLFACAPLQGEPVAKKLTPKEREALQLNEDLDELIEELQTEREKESAKLHSQYGEQLDKQRDELLAAQTIELNQNLSRADEERTQLNQERTHLNEQFTQLNEQITQLNEQLTERTATIDRLTKELEAEKAKAKVSAVPSAEHYKQLCRDKIEAVKDISEANKQLEATNKQLEAAKEMLKQKGVTFKYKQPSTTAAVILPTEGNPTPAKEGEPRSRT